MVALRQTSFLAKNAAILVVATVFATFGESGETVDPVDAEGNLDNSSLYKTCLNSFLGSIQVRCGGDCSTDDGSSECGSDCGSDDQPADREAKAPAFGPQPGPNGDSTTGTAGGDQGQATNPDSCSFGQSTIDHATLNYIHDAHDYIKSNTSTPWETVKLQRFYRSRDISYWSSFGPGNFCNYDLKLVPWTAESIVLFDPVALNQRRLVLRGGKFVDYHGNVTVSGLFYDANGNVVPDMSDLSLIATATLTRRDGAKYEFEMVELGNMLGGRLTRLEDRRGRGTTLTYKTWTAAELAAAPDRQWQIDTVTADDGTSMTFHYHASTVGGRWAVSQIDVPGGVSINYAYTNEKLSSVTHVDGAVSTFTYGVSSTGTHDTIDFFDPAASGPHRSKKVFLSPNTIVPASYNHILNTAAKLVRLVLNGGGEVGFYTTTATYQSPNYNTSSGMLIYQGSGRAVSLPRGDRLEVTHTKRATGLSTTHPQYGGFDLTATGYDNEVIFEPAVYYGGVSNGHISWIRDNRGITRSLNYVADAYDNGYPAAGAASSLQKVKYADNTEEIFCTDSNGRLIRYRDRIGRITKYNYDTVGNLLTKEVGITGPNGVVSGGGGGSGSGGNNGGGNLNLCDDSEDVQVAGEYAKYEWQYYAAGHANEYLLSAAIDPLGNTTNYEYDSVGRLTKEIQPPDVVSGPRAETTYAYNTAGRLASVTNPMGQTVNYDYDLRGRKIKTTYADGSTDRVVYGAIGSGDENLVVRTIDRMNVATDYEYDGDGRLTRKLEATFIVSATGTESAVSDPSVTSETTYEYLEGTRLVSKQIVEGSRTDYAYDYAHRLVSTTVYPNANTTLTSSNTYVNNQLFKTTDPYGRSTFYAYDATDGRRIRTIVGTVPEVDYADYAAVLNAVRDPDGTPNSTSLISDAILNAEGEAIESINGRGIVDTVTYDSRGRSTVNVQAATWADDSPTSVSARTETDYNVASNVTEVREPRYFDSSDTNGYQKCKTVYSYTGRNLLASTTAALGTVEAGTVSYEYDLAGRQTVRTDELNNDWTTVYSPCCGRLQAKIDPLGHGTIYNTDALGRVTHEARVADVLTHTYVNPTDADTYGEVTRQYDEAGRLIAQTQWLTPLGAVDPAVPPIYTGTPVNDSANPPTGLHGLTTSYEYDDDLTDAAGLDSTYSDYLTGLPALSADGTGSAVVVTALSGRQSIRLSDGVGRSLRTSVLSTDTNQRIATTVTYDATNNISGYGTVLDSVHDQGLGVTFARRIDKAGRTIEVLTAGSVTSTLTYNAGGKSISVRDAGGVGHDTAYDELGRPTTMTPTGSGPITTTGYNLAGMTINVSDADNNTTTTSYDASGRKVASTDRLGFTTSWTYDLVGNELSMTDAESQTTTYTYDVRNHQTQIQWPDHVGGTSPGDLNYGIEMFACDPAGRPNVTTRQDGTTVKLVYDLVGRMASREYRGLGVALTAPAANTDTFAYEADGNLISGFKDDYDNTIAFTYNDAGQLVAESMTLDNNTYTIQSTYNLTGDLASIEDPTGFRTQYTYLTKPGRPIDTISKQPSGGSATQLADFAYDAAGRETSRTLGTGGGATTTTRGYDGVGRLTSIDNDTHGELDFTYTYDSIGNIASETRGGTMSGSSWTATYDNEQRLTNWDISTGDDESWTLSSVGNWGTYDVGTASQNFTHGDTHELTNVAGLPGPDGPPAGALTYDSRGNMTSDTNGLTYTWDADGMLASVTVPNAAAVGLEGTHTYEYDVLGRRLAKTVDDVANTTTTKTTFVQRLETLPPLDTPGGQVVAEFESDGVATPMVSRRFIYGEYVDELLWMTHIGGSVEANLLLHQDLRYSVVGGTGTDSTSLLAIGSYKSFGLGSMMLTPAGIAAGTPTVPRGFTGRRYDSEADLYYFRSRMLNPVLGMFLARDTEMFIDGMNVYLAHFIPSSLDPSGTSGWGLNPPVGSGWPNYPMEIDPERTATATVVTLLVLTPVDETVVVVGVCGKACSYVKTSLIGTTITLRVNSVRRAMRLRKIQKQRNAEKIRKQREADEMRAKCEDMYDSQPGPPPDPIPEGSPGNLGTNPNWRTPTKKRR